ncbi:5'-nucleotidase [Terrimicrobium sacchariphilum]|uniref:5'-nucleotidase n=2 Tax=Terrimicrobium sacchariphilum TaxID=690879 RepID=A0A146GC53_TERSA|nr:5'-nucleotidase [Terrimicrobium sacchariphilum]
MTDADQVFREQGEETYREHQRTHLDIPFSKGVAFPFIRRLLHLNQVFKKELPVEVVVLSRNDPDSGRRFFASCEHYKLNISRGAFLCGKDPYPYIESFNASLFLSANDNDVRGALNAGMPAGLVLPTKAPDTPDSDELRVAFDFDGVLAGDEAEQVYQEKGLDLFHNAEVINANKPLKPGPLHDLAKKLSYWQKFEAKRKKEDSNFRPLLRVAIVTARNAPAHARFVRTLEEWGLTATETFFMGGIDKSRVLRVFKPHLFLDDQISHLKGVADEIPCVHIPFGIVNRKQATS